MAAVTLLEDIRAEQLALEAEVRDHAQRLLTQARSAVEHMHRLTPFALVVAGTHTQSYSLVWHTPRQREEILAEFNRLLEDDNVTATIMTTQKPFRAGHSAVVLSVQTPAWRELQVLPFHIDIETGHVVWDTPQVRRNFTSALKSACLN